MLEIESKRGHRVYKVKTFGTLHRATAAKLPTTSRPVNIITSFSEVALGELQCVTGIGKERA